MIKNLVKAPATVVGTVAHTIRHPRQSAGGAFALAKGTVGVLVSRHGQGTQPPPTEAARPTPDPTRADTKSDTKTGTKTGTKTDTKTDTTAEPAAPRKDQGDKLGEAAASSKAPAAGGGTKAAPAAKAAAKKAAAKKAAPTKAAPTKAAAKKTAAGPATKAAGPAPTSKAVKAAKAARPKPPAEPRPAVTTEPSAPSAKADAEEWLEEREEGDVEVTTPVGTTGAGLGKNPDTGEADLQQPGTEPLMDPSTTKRIKKETDTLRKAADPDKG